jgi:uncharacterized protein (DUF952 family)
MLCHDCLFVRTFSCHGVAMLIYKILLPSEWAEFEAVGRFDGSPFDRSSGFIHCSSREQMSGTARRVFAEEPALVVVAVDSQAVGESLRWEAAPDGGPFPHVYAPLPLHAIAAVYRVADAASVDEALPPE